VPLRRCAWSFLYSATVITFASGKSASETGKWAYSPWEACELYVNRVSRQGLGQD
jgi:hypothetical protein